MNVEHLAHDIFLLMLNLSQLRSTERIMSVFLGAMNDAQPVIRLSLFSEDDVEIPDGELVELTTMHYTFGHVILKRLSATPVPEIEVLVRNALRMLALILENRMQARVLANENLRLEQAVSVRTEELLRSNAQLEYLQNLLQNIVDAMPAALITLDDTGKILSWNQAALTLTQGALDGMQGRLLWHVCPELLRYQDMFVDVMQDNRVVQRHREPLAGESGTVYRDITAFPLLTEGGAGVVLRIEDVTRRVHLEQTALQTTKLASVGRLAAGVAHEINNPLGAIMQGTQIVQRAFDFGNEHTLDYLERAGLDAEALDRYVQMRGIPDYLEGIRMAGSRAAKIVSDLLSFSQRRTSDFALHDVNALVNQALDLAMTDYDLESRHDIRDIKLVRNFAPDLPDVLCDGPQIQQVILNLVRNAAYAMAEKHQNGASPGYCPQLTLRTRSRDQHVYIEVEDNGPGIPESVRSHLFEPFFTTKEVGGGTGLGLWVCWSIVVERHVGQIHVGSGDQGGARFVLVLPVSPPG